MKIQLNRLWTLAGEPTIFATKKAFDRAHHADVKGYKVHLIPAREAAREGVRNQVFALVNVPRGRLIAIRGDGSATWESINFALTLAGFIADTDPNLASLDRVCAITRETNQAQRDANGRQRQRDSYEQMQADDDAADSAARNLMGLT